jgi:D-glycero-D-manno-heptose 1,7-bisphosphate phosphatase
MTHQDLAHIHFRLEELLNNESEAHVEGVFYCPHETGTCSCRKPDVGLFLQAKQHWPDIDFQASAMVGDSLIDVQAGQSLGMRSIRLGRDVPDLDAAVDSLLGGCQSA